MYDLLATSASVICVYVHVHAYGVRRTHDVCVRLCVCRKLIALARAFDTFISARRTHSTEISGLLASKGFAAAAADSDAEAVQVIAGALAHRAQHV